VSTYREAGVDQAAADALVPFFAEQASRTRRCSTDADVGGFAGLFDLATVLKRYERPQLAVSTDTTGTKIELLREAGLHHTAGWDCVAMNVDDVVCSGAEPLLFVDCIAIERLDDEAVREAVRGVADACIEAGCELVGGETAQLPGLLVPGGYEVMGTCVGVVEADAVWGPHRVRAGDAIVGLAASGLHSNGFSLVRGVLGSATGPPPDGLLEPTAIYAQRLLEAARSFDVHAVVHVTGGGIPGNLPRALPDDLGATIDLDAWPRPDVYDWLEGCGVDSDEIRATFNLGLGMLVITPDADTAVGALTDRGVAAWTVGRVEAGHGLRLAGQT